MEPLDLTIAIPVKNEAQNLPDCLKSIGEGFASKIVIIDSDSNDGTVEIADENGIELLKFKWNGHFPKKRNWYLRNQCPETKWILFLDADEILTDVFKSKLRILLPKTDKVGYWLNYSIYFEGKALRGGYPLKKLALFRVGAGEYEQIDEDRWSELDMEIHEHPILQGEIGEIKSQIDHRDLRGLESWKRKHKDYAHWEAKRFIANRNNDAIRSQWTFKQRVKYLLLATPLIAPVFFVGSFIFMGGFLDGARGWRWAQLKSNYFNQVYKKIKQLEKS